jgi:hypothetical protein
MPVRDRVQRDTRIGIRTSLSIPELRILRMPFIRLIMPTPRMRRKTRTRTNIHRRVRILREQMQVGQELSERGGELGDCLPV